MVSTSGYGRTVRENQEDTSSLLASKVPAKEI